MTRRERARTAEIDVNINSDDNLSSISPTFTHRMITRSPLFPIRNRNYLVGVLIYPIDVFFSTEFHRVVILFLQHISSTPAATIDRLVSRLSK
jgi:hypothetical protein